MGLMSVRMDSHTDSAQVRRLEVVESGRRRRWSEDEKLRIVVESLNGPRLVSATARRYGIRQACCTHGGGLFGPSGIPCLYGRAYKPLWGRDG